MSPEIFDNLMVLRNVRVGGIRLDDIRPKFNGLAHQWQNLP